MKCTAGFRSSEVLPDTRPVCRKPCFRRSPALTAARYDRCRPGLNQLAFHVEDTATVEKLAADAAQRGWSLLFPELHPHAGGTQHYAACLANIDGLEAELVAFNPPENMALFPDSLQPTR